MNEKIMIIDDSEIVLQVTKSILEEADFKVVTRNTPFGATNAIIQEKPDLVLLDVSMPALTGDSIVGIVRGYDFLKHTKILLYSDRSSEELGKLVSDCGANGFIKKTGESLELIRQVKHWL